MLRLPFSTGHRATGRDDSLLFSRHFPRDYIPSEKDISRLPLALALARSFSPPASSSRRTKGTRVARGRRRRSLKSLRFLQLLGISSRPPPLRPLTYWSCVISHPPLLSLRPSNKGAKEEVRQFSFENAHRIVRRRIRRVLAPPTSSSFVDGSRRCSRCSIFVRDSLEAQRELAGLATPSTANSRRFVKHLEAVSVFVVYIRRSLPRSSAKRAPSSRISCPRRPLPSRQTAPRSNDRFDVVLRSCRFSTVAASQSTPYRASDLDARPLRFDSPTRFKRIAENRLREYV